MNEDSALSVSSITVKITIGLSFIVLLNYQMLSEASLLPSDSVWFLSIRMSVIPAEVKWKS